MNRGQLRRYITTVVIMGLIWALATVSGLADLQIVQTMDGERSDMLFKNNRLAMPMDGLMDSILMCETGELIVLSHEGAGRYWVGSYNVFTESMQGLADEMGAMFGDMGDAGGLGDFLGSLFGGQPQAVSELQVRVSKVGEETVAGYHAEHYAVETRTSGDWRLREEIWVSADLLKEVMSEAGACIDHFLDIQDALTGLGGFGLDEMFRVAESPEYRALHEKGFVVRRKSSYPGLMGMANDTSTVVVEVIHESISEDYFIVPDGYQQVDTMFDL